MRQQYQYKEFRRRSLMMIDVMNDIITDYQRQGYVLTVRQLYYQLVARDIIENTERSYKNITNLVNDARLAGLMDWSAIEDRTRDFVRRNHWESPSDIVRACANQYYEDMWVNQETRVFAIVEKEALVGVLERTCREFDVPLLAARGYPSGTVLREFAIDDLIPALTHGQRAVILHLGDHDPSGIDMTRDLAERIALFSEVETGEDSLQLIRIALNMDQIEELKPPENPAKSTDARFADYRRRYGASSWELDALSPSYLSNLIKGHIEDYIDPVRWEEREKRIDECRDRLSKAADSLKEEDNG